jgi:hypothetical protein
MALDEPAGPERTKPLSPWDAELIEKNVLYSGSIKAVDRRFEAELSLFAWPGYHFMHPVDRTRLFADAFRVAYGGC